MKRTFTAFAAVTGLALAAGILSGCEGDKPEEQSPDPVAAEQSATPEAPPADSSDSEVEPAEAEPGQVDAPSEGGTPEGMPPELPEIGLPFYMPSELMAITSEDDPWVLEFLTDDSLNAVNSSIADQFSEQHGWNDIVVDTSGEQTVTTGTKDGYLLVIAVAPERQDATKTSLYYTLSTLQ